MSNDVRKIILGTLAGFLALITIWVGFLFVVGCGGSLNCTKAQATAVRTSVPTLMPASLPTPKLGEAEVISLKCKVTATSLLAAWINAGYPETDPFQFTDANRTACSATFSQDIGPLFLDANLWYSGALSCASCHNADLSKASAHLDLSSYQGIVAGSRRPSSGAKGKDILGDGVWEDSKLYDVLYVQKVMPFGRPPDVPAEGPVIFAGQPSANAQTGTAIPGATETAQPAGGGEVARPSNPGGPGEAVDLGVNLDSGKQLFEANCAVCHGTDGVGGKPNAGSNDGTVPPLNPIDSTLVSTDYKSFATNLDLFIEHGSTPEGPSPMILMPAWGDKGLLTPQQIADVIGYTISLNNFKGEYPKPGQTTPATPAAEVARPSNPGGPGAAVELGVNLDSGKQLYDANCVVCHGAEGVGGKPNAGSADGTVPPLNPIDSTLVSTDYKTFATNVDLFMEHGSTPEGPSPMINMPAWGDKSLLTPQQIADVIGYVISLNNFKGEYPKPIEIPVATPAAEVARPSNPGGAGAALGLEVNLASGKQVYQANCAMCHGAEGVGGIPNPGSTDGTVPELNPIDPTLVSSDYKTFATNVDLFLEHGSTPEGTSPIMNMPAWGDKSLLTPQQIADVIGYVISLNNFKGTIPTK
jgi:mono/diheme cytochrome c family protein